MHSVIHRSEGKAPSITSNGGWCLYIFRSTHKHTEKKRYNCPQKQTQTLNKLDLMTVQPHMCGLSLYPPHSPPRHCFIIFCPAFHPTGQIIMFDDMALPPKFDIRFMEHTQHTPNGMRFSFDDGRSHILSVAFIPEMLIATTNKRFLLETKEKTRRENNQITANTAGDCALYTCVKHKYVHKLCIWEML